MNNNNFPTMSSKQRVKIVNDLLKKEGFDLEKVADCLGMKYSYVLNYRKLIMFILNVTINASSSFVMRGY